MNSVLSLRIILKSGSLHIFKVTHGRFQVDTLFLIYLGSFPHFQGLSVWIY